MHREPIVLWGARSQAIVLNELLSDSFRINAFLSDHQEDSPIDGVPVLSGHETIEAWSEANKQTPFAVAIGGAHGSERLAKMAYLSDLGLTPRTLIHRTSTVLTSDGNIGEGCQFLARSIVGVEAKVGKGVIINTGASVDHECVIGDGAHIGPGAILAGRVAVGERTFVGTGARVCPDIRIAPDTIIGAGAVVISDISKPGTYVGVPARRAR